MKTQIIRAGDGHVSFAELFYDLVFVFAITQVSHFVLHHFSLTGGLQALFLFLSIWWVWIYSTWVFNMLDPETVPVRLLLFALMVGGLFLSMALPGAFGDRGAVYGLAFAAMQLGRSLFVVLVAGESPRIRRTFSRISVWVGLSGVFWIVGGFSDSETRVYLWLVALALELIAPSLGYRIPGYGRDISTDWVINGGHMAERCGLFVIICLGETLLVSGATFAEMTWDLPGILAFGSAITGAVGMWWVYFHIGHKRGTHFIEHSDDPGALGRLAYTYFHIPIVAGVVLGAVGSELTIAHPFHHATWAEAAVIVGGPAVFLLGNGLYKWCSAPNFPLSHMIGLGLCVGLLGLSPFTNLLILNAVSALILIVVATLEQRSYRTVPTSAL